jgi:hypothetical protein
MTKHGDSRHSMTSGRRLAERAVAPDVATPVVGTPLAYSPANPFGLRVARTVIVNGREVRPGDGTTAGKFFANLLAAIIEAELGVTGWPGDLEEDVYNAVRDVARAEVEAAEHPERLAPYYLGDKGACDA